MDKRDYEMYSRIHDLINGDYADVSAADKCYAFTLLLIQSALSLGQSPGDICTNIAVLYPEVINTIQQQQQDNVQ